MRKSKKSSNQPKQIRTSKPVPAKIEPLRPKTEQLDKLYNDLAKFLSENPYPIMRIHKDGTVLYANKACEPLLKAKDSRVGGPAPSEWHRLVENVLASGRVAREEVKDNGRVFALRAVPVVESNYVNFYGVDITEQKSLEETLEKERQELMLIINSSPIIVFYKDKEGRFARVNKAFVKLLNIPEEKFLGKTVFDFYSAKIAQGMTNDDQEVFRTGRAKLNIVEQYESARGLRWVQTDKVPIFDKNGTLVGLVGFAQDITERKRAEEAMQESEEKFKTLADEAFDSIVIHDGEKIIEVNKAFGGLWGYDPKEAAGMKIDEFFAPECWEDAKKRVQSGYDRPYEAVTIRKDGTRFQVEIAGKSTTYKGKTVRIATARDITERKRAEEALQASEERFRGLFEQAADAIVVIDARTGKMTEFNDKAHQMLGYTRTEYTKLRLSDIEAIESKEEIAAHIDKIVRQGSDIFETKQGKKDGTLCDVLVSAKVVTIAGKQYIQGIWCDITERKQAEEDLRRSEESYRVIFENTGSATALIEDDTILSLANTEFARLSGFSKQEIEGKKSWTEFVVKEDLARMLEQHRLRRVNKEAAMKQYEFRFVTRTGNIRDIALLIDVIPGTKRSVAALMDITEHKRAQEELLWKTAFLESQVEANLDGVLVIDSNNQKILTNKRLIELWKVPQHIAEDKDDTALLQYVVSQTKYPEKFLEKVKYLYSHRDQTSRDEIEFKNGMVFDRYSSPVVDKNGKYFGRIWTFRDITERKLAEQALQTSETRLRELFKNISSGVTVYEAVDDGKDFIIKNLNGAAEKIEKVSKESIIGKRVTEVFPGVKEMGILDVFRRVWKTGKAEQHPTTFYKDERISGWRENYVYKLLSGEIVAVYDDVTERQAALEWLQEERNLLRTLIDHIPDDVYVKDKDGRFIICNKAVTGYWDAEGKSNIIGKTDFDLFEPATAQEYFDEEQKIMQTGQSLANMERQITDKTGIAHYHMTTKLSLRDNSGNIVGIVGINRDVTDRKKAEQKLLEYQRRLKRLAAQLSLAEERERRRIAGELHDHVSQSLALAKIKLDSLHAALSSQPMAGVIEDISGSIEKAIQDTRTLTFDLSNPILYEFGFEAAVSEWLDENVRVKHKINTEFQDDGKDKPLDDDMRALLFRNARELLINTIKYSGADKVRVSVRRIDGSIEVVVEDNGVGFDPVEVRTLASKRAEFGLFSIRESLEQLGGHFEIESKPGAGCKATMKAPFKSQSLKKED